MAHPFTSTLAGRATGVACALLFTLSTGVLVALHGHASPLVAVVHAALHGATFSLAAYLYWYAFDVTRGLPARVVACLFVQVLRVTICAGVLLALGLEFPWAAARSVPLHLILGSACWMALVQWYARRRDEAPANDTTIDDAPLPLDRVTTREGGKIHLIPVDEILYLQAYGDYVLLFTPSGRHLKEQTMKHFESVLPPAFARVHRSWIVNTRHVTRVELHGNSSCRLWISNGACLPASRAGYKRLKETYEGWG